MTSKSNVFSTNIHPQNIVLCQFVDEMLEDDMVQQVTEHLNSCTQCQHTVDLLQIPLPPLAKSIEEVDPKVRRNIKRLVAMSV